MLLQQAGARVAIADIDPARAKAVGEELGVTALVGDITRQEDAQRIVDQAHAALGGLKRVANIVGLVKMGALAEMSFADWDGQFRLNLHSQMFVAQAAGTAHARRRRGPEWGRLDRHGRLGQRLLRRAQPGGLWRRQGRRDVARPLAGRRMGAARHPGQLRRPGHHRGAAADRPDGHAIGRRALPSSTRWRCPKACRSRRFGRAEEIAKVLLFLLSDMSSFMTGQTLVNDGGTMVHFPHQTGGQRT